MDRIGLLYDVFNAIGSLGLEITHARINTEKGAAIDSLCVTDTHGHKLAAPAVASVKRELSSAVGLPHGNGS